MPRSKLDSVGEVIVRLLECWGRYYCWRYAAIDPRPTVILSRYHGKREKIIAKLGHFSTRKTRAGDTNIFPFQDLYYVIRIVLIVFVLYHIICIVLFANVSTSISRSLLFSKSPCKFVYISFYTYSWKQAKELNERLGSNTIELLQMFKYFRQPLCFFIAQRICH